MRPPLLAIPALAASLLLSGCATHLVRQSTLFAPPSAGPPQTSHGRVDGLVSGSGTTFIETQSRPADPESGSWLSRGQLDGQLAVRVSRFFSIRATGFVGFGEGAVAPRPTELERPGPVAFGGGPIASLGYAAEDEPFFARAELGVILGFYPSVLLVTSVEPCPCTITREEHLSFMPIVHGGVAVGYWLHEMFALSGGVVLRNQPALAQSGELGVVDEAVASIDFGGLAGIPWIAAELEIDHTVGIVAQVQMPLMADALLGPTLSLAVRGVIGQGPTGTRPPPPPRPTPDESGDDRAASAR